MKKPIILPLLMLIMVSGCGNKACDNPQRSRNNDEIQLGIILNQDLEYCQEVQNISPKKVWGQFVFAKENVIGKRCQ